MLSPKEVIRAWVKGYNDRDAASVAALYHDDATNLQVAIGIPLVGIKAITEQLQEFFQAVPDNFTKIENLFVDGDWAILEWSGGGTFKPTGKTFKFEGCGFFRITEGKIKFQRGYWDMASWKDRVGLN